MKKNLPEIEFEDAIKNCLKFNTIEQAAEYLESLNLTSEIQSVAIEDRQLKYINTGDTYDTTLCQEENELFISSWGNWYEEAENEHCQDNNVIRCGYCSEFTDLDRDDWREVICSHCGHCVAG